MMLNLLSCEKIGQVSDQLLSFVDNILQKLCESIVLFGGLFIINFFSHIDATCVQSTIIYINACDSVF